MPTDAEQRFIQAWRYAAPELEKIQRRELRDLDESAGLRMIGAPAQSDRPYSGLIEFQAWMMRMRVMQLNEQLARREPAECDIAANAATARSRGCQPTECDQQRRIAPKG